MGSDPSIDVSVCQSLNKKLQKNPKGCLKRCLKRCLNHKRCLGCLNSRHLLGRVFTLKTYFVLFFKNRDHFAGGTPNQGLLHDSTDDYCITLSLSGHFHPLIFDTFGQKYLFMDPGTLLDGTPNLE